MAEWENSKKRSEKKEKRKKNKGDRNTEGKGSRSRTNTNNSCEQPHGRGSNARISNHHAFFFYRVRFLRPFVHARMSAYIVVSSVSNAPISQLAEMRSQPQINDPTFAALARFYKAEHGHDAYPCQTSTQVRQTMLYYAY